MQNYMGEREQHKYQARLRKSSHSISKQSKRCGALCCGSRLSISSSSSSEGIRSSDSEQLGCLSSIAHGMVQERLEQMIKEREPRNDQWRRRDRIGGGSGGGRCIVLIAMDKSSYDPREDFRRSMSEVITSKGLEGPKELRSLLNCYMSMNSRVHRQVILEAFHEVCSTLFLCNRRI